ncbi:hypothetical protein BB560_007121, partial [Smittium megazygosporum]
SYSSFSNSSFGDKFQSLFYSSFVVLSISCMSYFGYLLFSQMNDPNDPSNILEKTHAYCLENPYLQSLLDVDFLALGMPSPSKAHRNRIISHSFVPFTASSNPCFKNMVNNSANPVLLHQVEFYLCPNNPSSKKNQLFAKVVVNLIKLSIFSLKMKSPLLLL